MSEAHGAAPPRAAPAEAGVTGVAGQRTDEGKGRIFPCEQCGADMTFHIGQQRQRCEHCGFERAIEIGDDAEVAEQDFAAMMERLVTLRSQGKPDEAGTHEVRCESCSAKVVFAGALTSTTCAYCGSPIQSEHAQRAEHRVPIDAVLPFRIEKERARANLLEWVRSRWFAPNDFRTRGAEEKFQGIYLPFWTYDSLTFNRYSGQRGEHYWVTVGHGKNQHRVRHTRWYPAAGNFQRFFDDVLIPATLRLPRRLLGALEPWPLAQCIPYTQQVLAGYLACTYEEDLGAGFHVARATMAAAIEREVRSRIGGDEQRIHGIDTRYDAVTYKHLILPGWMLASRYRDKVYQVTVNAATGEVQGERPYSWAKILAAAAAVAGAIALLVALAQ